MPKLESFLLEVLNRVAQIIGQYSGIETRLLSLSLLGPPSLQFRVRDEFPGGSFAVGWGRGVLLEADL